jgi:hypothetical protein
MEEWFKAKRLEVLAAAALPSDHAGLVGGHREEVVRGFLRSFLPGRLSVDRGIVYTPHDRSGECDVVVWDQANFPRLSMIDHSSFFAESVSLVIEVKSTYSHANLVEALQRCSKMRYLSMLAGSSSLMLQVEHRLVELRSRLAAVEAGVAYEGMLISGNRIPYGVIFLGGGATLTLGHVLSAAREASGAPPDAPVSVDDLPNFVCCLEPGSFIRRWEPSYDEWDNGENPSIERREPGDRVLADVANEVLRCVRVRSPGLDGMWDMAVYTDPWMPSDPAEWVELTLDRFPSGRKPYYGQPDDS